MLITIYLHGLNSFLNEEKRFLLQKHTEVIAPNMDYRNQPDAYQYIINLAQKEGINLIIGTSMGGFLGYYLSLGLNLPALLFNPALPHRSVPMEIPQMDKNRTNYLRVILGGQDDIINPKENLNWLTEHEKGEMDIKWVNTLGHRIPKDVFAQELSDFYTFIRTI